MHLGIKDLDLDEEISIRGYMVDGSEYEYRVNTQFNRITNTTATLTNIIEHLILKSDAGESLSHSVCEKTGRDLISYKFNIYEIIILTSDFYELGNINKLLNDWFVNKRVVMIAIYWVGKSQNIKELLNTSKLYS